MRSEKKKRKVKGSHNEIPEKLNETAAAGRRRRGGKDTHLDVAIAQAREKQAPPLSAKWHCEGPAYKVVSGEILSSPKATEEWNSPVGEEKVVPSGASLQCFPALLEGCRQNMC